MALPSNPEAEYLTNRFGEHLVGLIQYGSTVFGETRTGSVHDFWLIVDDLRAFHRSPAMRAVHRTNHTDPIGEHVRLNASGPNYYAIRDSGAENVLSSLTPSGNLVHFPEAGKDSGLGI